MMIQKIMESIKIKINFCKKYFLNFVAHKFFIAIKIIYLFEKIKFVTTTFFMIIKKIYVL